MSSVTDAVPFLRHIRVKTRAARRERFDAFLANVRRGLAKSHGSVKVMDIGGTVAFWEDWWKLSECDGLHVTLINNHARDTTNKDRGSTSLLVENVCRDANSLTLAELCQYDLIFSNSFFEHLGSRDEQSALARAVAASGLPYFVQVPNKRSPVDPHHPFAPFFAVYPFWLRVNLLRLSGFGGGRAASLGEARERERYYNPLGQADMRELFPDASIVIEKPLGIPMSILAFNSGTAAAALAA
jgi:hypothetical protein